jgi:hypothetical protein
MPGSRKERVLYLSYERFPDEKGFKPVQDGLLVEREFSRGTALRSTRIISSRATW